MRDLTQGAIWKHLAGMSVFIAIGLLVQTLYLLIDLYFVSRLGKEAVAGVAAAGTSTFLTMAVSQLVAVGALSLISQAVGRKDKGDAQLVFEQALSLGLVIGAAFLVLGYLLGRSLIALVAADAVTAGNAVTYFYWFLPSLVVLFPGAALGSALRASGVVGAPMMIQSATVLVNAILAPVLIAGWLSGHAMGVAGAGLASSIAASVGTLAMLILFNRLQKHIRLHGALKPDFAVWGRLTKVGLPATGEFAMLFLVISIAYWAIQSFGPQAQAGFGIGSRVMQAIFLPAMAVAFATAPIAGQNFGARQAERVRATFSHAAMISSIIMLALTLLCHVSPRLLVSPFTKDPAVIAVAVEYLRISSWNFVAVGLVFSCSGMFQALGDTRPALISSASRLVTYAVPAAWLKAQPWVTLHDFWYLSVASITVQMVVSLFLLRHQLHHKLKLLVVQV
jgi:putative MATE family efflux protein